MTGHISTKLIKSQYLALDEYIGDDDNFKQKNSLNGCFFFGGPDETRTRDPCRDRAVL